jgi:hypothetical protein
MSSILRYLQHEQLIDLDNCISSSSPLPQRSFTTVRPCHERRQETARSCSLWGLSRVIRDYMQSWSILQRRLCLFSHHCARSVHRTYKCLTCFCSIDIKSNLVGLRHVPEHRPSFEFIATRTRIRRVITMLCPSDHIVFKPTVLSRNS